MPEALNVDDSAGVGTSARYMEPPVFVFLPAMGVAASFYEPFVRELERSCGATVLTLDLPGQGASPLRARAGDDFGYREAVEELIPSALRRARREHGGRRPLLLAGHSLGGQLAALACAEAAALLDGLVLIAAGTAHWRTWPRGYRWLAAVTVHAIATAAMLLPWYPGEILKFGGNQARRLMRDWSFNARTGGYRLEGSARTPHELADALRDVSLPVLSISITGDPIAPPGARDELLSYLPAALVTCATVPGVPAHTRWRRHFSWARQPDSVAASVARWLRAHRSAASSDAALKPADIGVALT